MVLGGTVRSSSTCVCPGSVSFLKMLLMLLIKSIQETEETKGDEERKSPDLTQTLLLLCVDVHGRFEESVRFY